MLTINVPIPNQMDGDSHVNITDLP